MTKIICSLMLGVLTAWASGASAEEFLLKVGGKIKLEGSFIGLETNEYIHVESVSNKKDHP